MENVQPEEVRVARLDQLYPDIVRRMGCQNILLKMDTQGYDRNVFDGSSGVINAVKCLQTELSLISVYEGMGKPYDLLNRFHQHGVEISGMYPINHDAESMAVIEYDCILVRHSSRTES